MLLPDMGANDPALLRRIIQAWDDVKRVNKLKRKGGPGGETYSQWILKRVQQVKLPFLVKAPAVPLPSVPAPVSIEEADELKATIARLQKEKEDVEADLLKVNRENFKLKQNEARNKETIRDLRKDLETEKEAKLRVDDVLEGTTAVARTRNKQIRSLELRSGGALILWDKALAEKAKLKEKFEVERQGFRNELEVQKRKLHDATEKFENKLKMERQGFRMDLEAQRERFRGMKEDYENLLVSERQRQGMDFESLLRLKEESWRRELTKSNFDLNQERLRVRELRGALDHLRMQLEGLKMDRDGYMHHCFNLTAEIQDVQEERDDWWIRFSALAKIANAAIIHS